MKCFLTVKQYRSDYSLPLNKQTQFILLTVILSFVAMSALAETNYLFPSDIIDQTEQARYETGRADRYATQRNWTFPEVSKSSGQKPNYSEQYISIDGRPALEQNTRARHHPGDASLKWFEDSEHYKYDNFRSGQAEQAFQQQTTDKQVYNSAQTYSGVNLPDNAYYPTRKLLKHFDRRNRRYVRPDPRQNPSLNDSVNSYNNAQGRLSRSYPNLLYPSDMERQQNSGRRKAYTMNSFSSNSFNERLPMYRNPAAQNQQIQYVPVPVYGVPGTLPGTVPGVVTPANMVPGYSHLSPAYNFAVPGTGTFNRKRLNNNAYGNLLATPYSPMSSGLGAFPGVSNPFDSFYKTYENNSQHSWPFTSPENMVPGYPGYR